MPYRVKCLLKVDECNVQRFLVTLIFGYYIFQNKHMITDDDDGDDDLLFIWSYDSFEINSALT